MSVLEYSAVATGVLGGLTAAYLGGKAVREKVLVPKLTVMSDLPLLKEERRGQKLPGQAVVCGGSISGLITAAICSKHFEEVLVVEPDGIDLSVDSDGSVSMKRSKVPHMASFHGFQPMSLLALRSIFPSFEEVARKMGIIPSDADYKTYFSDFPILPPSAFYEDGECPETLVCSRETLETLLRRLVLRDIPNLRAVTGSVKALYKSPHSTSLVGVAIDRHDGYEAVEPANLVVDVSGASQVGYNKWLPDIGVDLSSVERSQYDAKWVSLSATISVPVDIQDKLPVDWGLQTQKWLYNRLPDLSHGETTWAGLLIEENDKLVIGCGGWNAHCDFNSLDEVLYFVRSVGQSVPDWIMEMLEILVENEKSLQVQYSHWRMGPQSNIKYEDVPAGFPNNFVAIGDSVMVVNPIFGQGFSKAILGAVSLDKTLRTLPATVRSDAILPRDFSRTFFRTQSARTEFVWTTTKANDYSVQSTIPVRGENLAQKSLQAEFSRRLLGLIQTDPNAARIAHSVRAFTAPPTDLYSPSVLTKVALLWLSGY